MSLFYSRNKGYVRFSDILLKEKEPASVPRHLLYPPTLPLAPLYPKEGELDSNRNLLTGSLYLSLGAVHAAAAAAMANSATTQGHYRESEEISTKTFPRT